MKKNIQTYLSIFALIGIGISCVIWIYSTIDLKIEPVEAKADKNTEEISDVKVEVGKANTKLDFLLEERGAKYDEEKGVIIKNK